MQTLATMLRSKMGLAVCGVILVGGLGGILGASSVARPSVQANNGGITNTNTGTATDTTGSATQGPGGSALPTDTVTVPTNTTGGGGGVIGTGQTIDLHGAIGTIDTAENTFILKVGGTSVTVEVSGQTSFQGASTSFQGLRTGWVAEVKGRAQSDGTFQAFVVNSDIGNA